MEHLEVLMPLLLVPFTLAAIYGAVWPEARSGSKGHR